MGRNNFCTQRRRHEVPLTPEEAEQPCKSIPDMPCQSHAPRPQGYQHACRPADSVQQTPHLLVTPYLHTLISAMQNPSPQQQKALALATAPARAGA